MITYKHVLFFGSLKLTEETVEIALKCLVLFGIVLVVLYFLTGIYVLYNEAPVRYKIRKINSFLGFFKAIVIDVPLYIIIAMFRTVIWPIALKKELKRTHKGLNRH